VPDKHDRLRQGVDHGDDRVDVIAQADGGAVGVARLHAGKGEGVHGVPRLAQGFGHVVPRRAVEPESGNENDVHAATIRPITDIARGDEPRTGSARNGLTARPPGVQGRSERQERSA
jgi:hypothetical protein